MKPEDKTYRAESYTRLAVDIPRAEYDACWRKLPYGMQTAIIRTVTTILIPIINTKELGLGYIMRWLQGEAPLTLPAPKENQRWY